MGVIDVYLSQIECILLKANKMWQRHNLPPLTLIIIALHRNLLQLISIKMLLLNILIKPCFFSLEMEQLIERISLPWIGCFPLEFYTVNF